MSKSKVFIGSKILGVCFTPAFVSSTIVTSILVLLICSIGQLGYLQSFELAAFDLMLRWDKNSSKRSPQPKTRSRITLVEITEADIKTWKQSTFSDRLIAKLLAELQKNAPKAIGLDIYRDISQPPGNKALAKQLEADNIIAITNISPKGTVPAPPSVPPSRVGFNNLMLDLDGKVRRNFMSASLGDRQVYSFGFQLARNYLEIEEELEVGENYLKLQQTVFPAIKADIGGYQLSNSDVFGVQVLLKYQPFETIAQRLSFTEVLEGNYPPDWIENKIVIIGYTAPSKKDVFATPYSTAQRIPGAEIHVQMVNQILSTTLDRQPLIRSMPQWGETIWIWVWSFTGAVLVWRTKVLALIGGSLAIFGGLSGICLGAFFIGFWLPIVPTSIALIGTTIAVFGYKTFRESISDELTGLANGKQIVKQLKKAIARSPQGQIAVLSLEIERFKTINESLGQEISDLLIILVGKRIQNCIRPHDKLAKGEQAQFTLVLFTLIDRQQALKIATRIQQELAQTFKIQDKEVLISTNVGIDFCDSTTAISAPELLRNSSIAKDRARILGKNMYAVFAPRMHLETVAQWELENDLRQGIVAREFELYYQPIINLKTKRLAGFEALIRWISPTRGFVSPGEFIPLAEATELIVPLGDWILHTACQQMQQWDRQFTISEELVMSVNLSSHQFLPDLISKVQQVLDETKLMPQSLKLEITESAMMANIDEAIALLQQLKALGIKLSIDDFGTGYSSLSYLQQFCADTLKVDRAFVQQMESSDKDLAIVEIIIHLAHRLEMNIIAEGIETTSQEQILTALNCEYGQGYLFAKPLKCEDATNFLAQQFANRN